MGKLKARGGWLRRPFWLGWVCFNEAHVKMENNRVSALSQRGYSEDSLIAIWDLFYPVRHLLYGRTSAASDALMIYRHAWLKLHYPKEYEEVFPSKENQKTGG